MNQTSACETLVVVDTRIPCVCLAIGCCVVLVGLRFALVTSVDIKCDLRVKRQRSEAKYASFSFSLNFEFSRLLLLFILFSAGQRFFLELYVMPRRHCSPCIILSQHIFRYSSSLASGFRSRFVEFS